uniref:Putative secreted protein n=1 Tax=Anopheles darlingi TaxID=43151 RepID=A0A2M4D486_ANODA
MLRFRQLAFSLCNVEYVFTIALYGIFFPVHRTVKMFCFTSLEKKCFRRIVPRRIKPSRSVKIAQSLFATIPLLKPKLSSDRTLHTPQAVEPRLTSDFLCILESLASGSAALFFRRMNLCFRNTPNALALGAVCCTALG